MLIYQDSTQQFIQDVRENRLTDIMCDGFSTLLGKRPSPGEVNSWQNSLPRVRDIIELAGLTDNTIALEYEVPYNQSRIDCLLFGRNQSSEASVVLIELKQWTEVIPMEDEGNFIEEYSVETFVGKRNKIVAHPSQQAKGYQNYLKNFIAEFETPPVLNIFSCAYCHNYTPYANEGLFSPIYEKIIEEYPVYTKKDTRIIAEKIKELLINGDGLDVFNRFMRSPIQPSAKLLDNVAKIIQNEQIFSLLNEQLVAKNLIWSKVRKSEKNKEKSVVIVHGGPGTGKSVIALNLLAEAATRRKKVFYGCKSKPFTEGLKNLIKGDGKELFSNLYRFLPTKIKENNLDLLLVDEAHRIEKNSNHQYTKAIDKTDLPQIDQLIRCAKTSVFFIDDKQNVRSQEIGSSELIREAARAAGCRLDEVTLDTQYRCMGSNDYLLWLESTLGYNDEERKLRKNEIFDFKIMDSPAAIMEIINEKERQKANSARMIAGFCWPWSKTLDNNGEFVKDVVIGDFAMPWETHGDINKPPKGYVKWYEWAYKTEGVKQIGCIYTAQGFEFDYVGVIIGDDLVYDAPSNSLKTDINGTKDPTLRRSKDTFDSHVRNIYRTLMSRGMRGCYVCFINKDTETYFRSRLE